MAKKIEEEIVVEKEETTSVDSGKKLTLGALHNYKQFLNLNNLEIIKLYSLYSKDKNFKTFEETFDYISKFAVANSLSIIESIEFHLIGK